MAGGPGSTASQMAGSGSAIAVAVEMEGDARPRDEHARPPATTSTDPAEPVTAPTTALPTANLSDNPPFQHRPEPLPKALEPEALKLRAEKVLPTAAGIQACSELQASRAFGTDRLLVRSLELISELEKAAELHCNKDRALAWLVYDVTGAPLDADAEKEGGRLRKRVTTGAVGKELISIERAAAADVRRAKAGFDDGAALEARLAELAEGKEAKLAALLDRPFPQAIDGSGKRPRPVEPEWVGDPEPTSQRKARLPQAPVPASTPVPASVPAPKPTPPSVLNTEYAYVAPSDPPHPPPPDMNKSNALPGLSNLELYAKSAEWRGGYEEGRQAMAEELHRERCRRWSTLDKDEERATRVQLAEVIGMLQHAMTRMYFQAKHLSAQAALDVHDAEVEAWLAKVALDPDDLELRADKPVDPTSILLHGGRQSVEFSDQQAGSSSSAFTWGMYLDACRESFGELVQRLDTPYDFH